tara:strand:- start:150 stop:347 length:198 start_codon:yes stop_codon:yes gene_type:complete
MSLSADECESLITLVDREQIIIINDEENEYWNDIRRKLLKIKHGGVVCSIDDVEVDCDTWELDNE